MEASQGGIVLGAASLPLHLERVDMVFFLRTAAPILPGKRSALVEAGPDG